MAGLFQEMKRRNVFRVGLAYLAVAWLLLQVADLILEATTAPQWVLQALLIVAGLGFLPALILAWAFEMTPDGVKAEKNVDRSNSVTPNTGRKLDRIIIVTMAAVIIVLVCERFLFVSDPEPIINASTEIDRTVAVLPFADLSQSGDQEWFADGLAEEILNALAKTPDILVSSRTSSFAYKGTDKDMPTIANELGVAHVLEGSVRRAGERLRVTAQLIRASDGFHVWSENYDRGAEDVIDIQEDLALKIASALETTMDPVALAEMVRVGTRSVEAFETYLQGVALRQRGAAFGDRQADLAYDAFESARAQDPGFFDAHAQAADFWVAQLSPTNFTYGLTNKSPLEIRAEFISRIDAAIAATNDPLNQMRGEAQKANIDLRWSAAISLMKNYMDSRPNDGRILRVLASIAATAGDSETGRAALARLREQAEDRADAAGSYMNRAYIFGNASDAADLGQSWLNRWPNHKGLLYQTHRTLMWAMRVEEGAALADRYAQLFPNDDALDAISARQACAEGRRDDVVDILNFRRADGKPDTWIDWQILMLLGDNHGAEMIVRQYEDPQVVYPLTSWLSYPHFDPGPFPALMAALERENVNRPPPIAMPFACPPE